MIFKGQLCHDSLLKYVSTEEVNAEILLKEGDTLEIYNNDNGDVSRIVHNNKDIKFKTEDTPLISIVDACEEI